jgi:FtsH-binding integral membrane protein
MYAVYAWMAAALSISAVTAYYVAHTPAVFSFINHNPFVFFMIILAQLGLVVSLSLMVMRVSFATACAMFFAYAISVGATLAVVLHMYTMASIGSTFLTAAGMFGGMALYGYITNADLTAVGSIAKMALLGLILSMLINMLFANPAFDMMISGCGVLVFCLLTAYDTQKIKQIAYELITDEETLSKVALICALTLYLDFINLFLFLLRFLGKRRQD